jgi:CheY-like chemotaxis protein
LGYQETKPLDSKESHLLKDVDVLVVDDSPDNQTIIGLFLESAGAKVDFTDNGEEGVKKALAGHYDVVLMDIQMPYLDGYEATSQLRNRGYTQPIIALTAHALKEERDRCLRVGCTDHMTKPIDRRKLVSQVARVVHEFSVPCHQ